MTEPLTWATEQVNPATVDIDTLPSSGVVERILNQDAGIVAAVRARSVEITRAVDLIVAALAAGGAAHYVGAGTSGRLGVLDAVELYPTFGVGPEQVQAHLAGGDPAMFRAAEGAEDDADAGAALVAEFGAHDVVVGLAASGRTPYVRGALEAAGERALGTVLIAANPRAPLAHLADVSILVDTGPEALTGSTRMKAGTAQKLVLNTISTAVMVRLGRTFSNLMSHVVVTNDKLQRRSIQLLQQATGRDERTCAAMLDAAGGRLDVALVALLADADAAAAADALAGLPPDPRRLGDPGGVRTAVQIVRGQMVRGQAREQVNRS